MKKLIAVFAFIFLIACNTVEEPINVSPNDLHNAIDKVTDIMIHDIFSPPVASRVYAYPNIAAYEIIAVEDKNYSPLANQVRKI